MKLRFDNLSSEQGAQHHLTPFMPWEQYGLCLFLLASIEISCEHVSNGRELVR